MPEFLAENNICGQTVLQLVSRGNAIIAELLRLKDYIPSVFRLETKQDIQKYGEIIFDFSYFKVAEALENKIESSEVLQDLDEEFRENHLPIISRFYSVFEGIHVFVSDLNHFLDELDEGLYIHQTLESIFQDIEGKQLMCEALYLYGLMLTLVDAHIEGIIRERLLVSYYRYTPQKSDTQSAIDDVCKLLRDTGVTSGKKPNNYPEDYFRRIPIKSNFIDIVIGRLRSDDIYDQLSTYPMSQHRSTALAGQGTMLYVCLFFSTNILHSQMSVMREIVDKYFPDNWILSVYMGHTVNLIETWDSFKAAKQALNNTLDPTNVKGYAVTHGENLPDLLKTSAQFLKEGAITNETLLRDINKIVNALRNCNVTLRWLLLHTVTKHSKTERNKRCKQVRDLVIAATKYDAVNLFKLLLNTAQLELRVKDIYKNLLAEKEKQWEELKKESYNSIVELSEVFGGIKPLTRIEKNSTLEKWFLTISKQIGSLENDSSDSSRKIVLLIQALEDVREFHQLDSNMQVVQYLSETCAYLHQMIRNMNIKEDVLIVLQIIGDVSYAWELVDFFTPIMQLGIKREPTIVIKLRAIFLKLASALEIPLMRINQAQSEDLISVSQYYSSELETYVRKVVQIIPEMMFEKLARIIEIQTSVLKELPTRLDKDKMRDFAQLDVRFEFAELTHSVSVFSEGMRMMKSTLVGVIRLDPKELLEDGIRKELVRHVSKALNDGLTFSSKPKLEELEQKILALGKIMDGYKRSFEYIQDYVNVNGLKIWQEEVTRIINFNVEQECNGFLRNKIHSWESAYQNRHVPIPYYAPTDNVSENFIGRLAREVIRLTDPRYALYIHQTSTWYDGKTHKAIFTKQTMSQISLAIEVTGLVGLDRLFSFMITANLKKINTFLENKHSKSNTKYNILLNVINEMKSITEATNIPKLYQNCINRTSKIWAEFLDSAVTIGQLQLLRNLTAFTLNLSAKFNAKNLESSLNSLNKALLFDAIKGELKVPSEELMYTLSQYFDYAGMNNPFQKVYLTTHFRDDYVITMFFFVIAHLSKLFILRNTAHRSRQDQIDGTAFAVGVHTIFKQFNDNLNESFVKYLVEYCTGLGKCFFNSKNPLDLPAEILLTVKFLDIYTSFSQRSNEHFRNYMPEEVSHLLQSLTPNS